MFILKKISENMREPEIVLKTEKVEELVKIKETEEEKENNDFIFYIEEENKNETKFFSVLEYKKSLSIITKKSLES